MTVLALPQTAPLRVDRLGVVVYRAPIELPVLTAFGAMTDRPAVIVRAEGGGLAGYGEIWCNFPTCGAEHRARLLESVFRPWVLDREWASPAEAFAELTARSHKLALQSGEPGPIAQVIAGIDTALWDLAARHAGLPLWRLLGGDRDRVPAYASGINPDRAVAQAEEAKAAGFRAFKLKIGFGTELDLANLGALRARMGADAPIAVDANQAWDLDEAIAMAQALARHAPLWLEEPLAADSPVEDWQRLAEASPIPLAAGENLRGDAAFDAAIASGALAFVQPDLAKWGGITACLPLARRIVGAGLCYCPHFLGGGIGLLASAHLLAAAGGDGLLEVDSNANPLREELAAPFPALADGQFVLPEQPGLGVAPGAAVERFAIPIQA
jgi:L-alanine-DL-glutamate epimerase-like enolase superfamily enzyme